MRKALSSSLYKCFVGQWCQSKLFWGGGALWRAKGPEWSAKCCKEGSAGCTLIRRSHKNFWKSTRKPVHFFCFLASFGGGEKIPMPQYYIGGNHCPLASPQLTLLTLSQTTLVVILFKKTLNKLSQNIHLSGPPFGTDHGEVSIPCLPCIHAVAWRGLCEHFWRPNIQTVYLQNDSGCVSIQAIYR